MFESARWAKVTINWFKIKMNDVKIAYAQSNDLQSIIRDFQNDLDPMVIIGDFSTATFGRS